MVKVIADNYVKEECINDFLAVTKELVEKTNALDPGCIKYELCRDVNDPKHFVMLEEWQDQKSLDEHMKAPHFTELVPKLHVLGEKPTGIAIFEKVH